MMEKGSKFLFWGTSTAEDEDERLSQFMLEQEEGHTLDIVLKATIKAKSLATKQVGVILSPHSTRIHAHVPNTRWHSDHTVAIYSSVALNHCDDRSILEHTKHTMEPLSKTAAID